METPPLPTCRSALFLDFDGTLVPLAETPDAIRPDPALLPLLAGLQGRLDGALAIITGRQIEVLDRYLAPLCLPAAGEHGLRRRDCSGRLHGRACAMPAPVLQLCHALAQEHPALLVERKPSSIALHYRRAPQLAALCLETLTRALQRWPQLELLQGKCVLEVRPADMGSGMGSGKGSAIAAFLRESPFAGRVPVFVGDDVTDESGFAVVQAHGGMAIKVGEGASGARHRLDSPQAVHAWLQSACMHLAAQTCAEALP
ncbi:trehalose-phosphatase [Delftia acidovorans]|uniref:trehalose-phosphatase n=1 Tax=Delftia acidovorans TaxID=80866 RepID=UPI003340B05D